MDTELILYISMGMMAGGYAISLLWIFVMTRRFSNEVESLQAEITGARFNSDGRVKVEREFRAELDKIRVSTAKELESANMKVANSEAKLLEVLKEAEALKAAQGEGGTEDVDALKDHVEDLEEELERVRLLADSAKEELEKSDGEAKARIAELETALEEKQAQIQAAPAAEVVDQAGSRLEELEGRLGARDLEIDSLKFQLKEAEDLVREREEEIQTDQGEVEAQKAEAERYRVELEAQRGEAEAQKAETERYRAELESQRVEACQIQADRDVNTTEMEGVKVERDAMKAELDRIRAELDVQKAEHEGLQAEVDVLRTQEDSGPDAELFMREFDELKRVSEDIRRRVSESGDRARALGEKSREGAELMAGLTAGSPPQEAGFKDTMRKYQDQINRFKDKGNRS